MGPALKGPLRVVCAIQRAREKPVSKTFSPTCGLSLSDSQPSQSASSNSEGCAPGSPKDGAKGAWSSSV